MEDVFGFWDLKTTADLVEACRNKLYPPRFNIDVYGEEAIKSTHFKVTFKGGVDELKTEILLERPTRRELILLSICILTVTVHTIYTLFMYIGTPSAELVVPVSLNIVLSHC